MKGKRKKRWREGNVRIVFPTDKHVDNFCGKCRNCWWDGTVSQCLVCDWCSDVPASSVLHGITQAPNEDINFASDSLLYPLPSTPQKLFTFGEFMWKLWAFVWHLPSLSTHSRLYSHIFLYLISLQLFTVYLISKFADSS